MILGEFMMKAQIELVAYKARRCFFPSKSMKYKGIAYLKKEEMEEWINYKCTVGGYWNNYMKYSFSKEHAHIVIIWNLMSLIFILYYTFINLLNNTELDEVYKKLYWLYNVMHDQKDAANIYTQKHCSCCSCGCFLVTEIPKLCYCLK